MILNNIPSLYYFTSEITLIIGIISLLIVSVKKNVDILALRITIVTSLVAFILTVGSFDTYATLFLGSIVVDPFANFFKLIFLFTIIVVSILTCYDKDVDRDDWPEYFTLLLILESLS